VSNWTPSTTTEPHHAKAHNQPARITRMDQPDTTGMFTECTNVEAGVMVAIGAAVALGSSDLEYEEITDRAEALGVELARWLQTRGIDDEL
jgi:hypothetical protein